MAKVNLNTGILGLEGKVINATKEAFVIIRTEGKKDEFLKGEKGNDIIISQETPADSLKLKAVLIQSLLTETKETSVEDKAKKYALFFRIEKNEELTIDFTSEDISFLKKSVSATTSILVAGRVSDILEGN